MSVKHFRRYALGATAALVLAGTLPAVAAAPAAAQESYTYLQTTCSVKALTPDGGLHGDGCSVWSLPTPVTVGSSSSNRLPDAIAKPVAGCLESGGIELVKVSSELSELPKQWAWGMGAAYFAFECVSGAAQAMIDLGNL